MGLLLYVPMILTAAFLLGCLAIALTGVRQEKKAAVPAAVASQSQSDTEDAVQKSPVKTSAGLRYRYVVRNADSDSALPASADLATPTLRLPTEHYINFIPPKPGQVAYLTFDDGPSENTEAILDILDYYRVKATFFVIYHAGMEQRYRAIAERGHAIGLHSYSHNYAKVYRSEEAFFDEMTRIGSYVENVTGVHTTLMRFPGGSSNTVSRRYSTGLMDKLRVSVEEKGYVYFDWNVDTEDAAHTNLDPDSILKNVRRDLKGCAQANILMHDSGATKQTTVETLPELIEYLYAQGYKMEALTPESPAVHHQW